MTVETQTRLAIADNFAAKRRYIGTRRQISVPLVFQGKGFKEIRFQATLEVSRRWKGDIIDVFEALQETTPFEMSKFDLRAPGDRQKIQGVESLAQALTALRDVGAEQITVTVRKPTYHPGSFNFGPSFQSICIEAVMGDIHYEAVRIVEFPAFGTKLGSELVFGKTTLKRKLANWLLK